MKPDDPDAKIKFRVVETLREVGGLAFDTYRDRFANELGRRNFVTRERCGRTNLNVTMHAETSDDMVLAVQALHGTRCHEAPQVWCSTCRRYGSARLKMHDSIEAHFQASLKMAQDPDGGPFPAYPSGKSWDKASGKKGSGKLFYHNVISGADFATQPYCVDCVVFGRVARGACTRYMLCGRLDPAAGSVNVASRWRTLS